MKSFIFLVSLTLSVTSLIAQQKILFDNTKSETAGNADWVIDNDQPTPSPAQSGITSTSPENYWLGGLSSWGVEMVKQGFWVETLPSSGRITYNDGANSQDLSNYDVFVVCEPNNPFTSSEKAAMMDFVYNGGGLFIVADHAIADRDGDGWDALMVWNDFMTNNPVKSNPFGFTFDAGSNISANPTLNVSTLSTDPILHGIKGDVLGIAFFNGGMMTISTTDNPSVKAAVYQTGYSNTGTTGVMVAYATYGSGKVVAVGDSSVPEDETAQSGTTYPGWSQPSVGSVADGDDGVLMTNATIWLAQSGSVVVDPEPTSNATTFSAIEPTSNSIKLTWVDAIGGTLPSGYLVKWSTNAASISNPIDGSAEANGVGAKNISQGTQTTTITGLIANTVYYFKIFPYTNAGSSIDYLVSSAPSASAATLEGASIINSENFDNCSAKTWNTYDVSGDNYWVCGSGYAEMNGYGGTVDEDWLISPALNLDNFSNEVLSFSTATQYTGPALELVYSTNYDGISNPSSQGTWSSLSYVLATTTSFTSSGNVSLASISGSSVYLAFKYKATGTISGTAALWRVDDINIEGLTLTGNIAPTIQASNISFSEVGENVMTVNWTNGNGGNRIVKMNTSNSFINPVDGSNPTANSAYTGGEQVVFNSTGNTVVVTGLSINVTYWFSVYEYNGTEANTVYNVSPAVNNPKSQATHDLTPPSVLSFSPIDNATTVNNSDNLALTFSENVVRGTAGNITVYNSNASAFESIPYNDSRISFTDNVVTIYPTNPFVSGSAYYVNIDANVILDLAGNPYLGISDNSTWNFVTQSVNSILEPTDSEIMVYPNPTEGLFTIIAPDNPRQISVSVFDINGKPIKYFNAAESFDISSYAKGVYIVKIKIAGKSYKRKLILQ